MPDGTVKVVLLPVHAKFVVAAKAGDARPSEANDTETDAMKSAARRRKGCSFVMTRKSDQLAALGASPAVESVSVSD